jgi:cytochrome c553
MSNRWILAAFVAIIIFAPGRRVWGADPPVFSRWDFGAEETTALQSHGGVHRDIPGPRPPDYPDFVAGNTAVRLDGSGAHLSVEDTGTNSLFDFADGDAITLESWVQVDDLKGSQNVYVIGKGRTGAEGFAADNQNWALRIRDVGGQIGLSFLFATTPVPNAAKSDAHWHRWNTGGGFKPGRNWHHVAVAYKFGEPESIRGWIDGKPQTGVWDMGGKTSEPPVVDHDAVWIGSSQRGAASSSLHGSLDSVVIHRQLLDDAAMKARYHFTGTEIVENAAAEITPDVGEIERGTVLFAFHEGFPSHNRWLNEGESLPAETLRWFGHAFIMNRLPQRYDDWGIRDSWKGPVLVRMAADINLPPGKRQFLMRVRGLSRLWVNGQIIARGKPLSGSPSGEEPMTPVPLPLSPGIRLPEHRQQEIVGEYEVTENRVCRVILETMVGAKDLRTDPGEICVAVPTSDGLSFALLPDSIDGGQQILLNDHDVTSALVRQEIELAAFDDQRRRAAAATQDAFWQQRHEQARAWATQHPAPEIPLADRHPIDAFLESKIQQARTASAQTPVAEAQQFHDDVLPLLRDQCFRCHGEKVNGGLNLSTLETAKHGGDSGLPAITPGTTATSELIRRIRLTDPEERMPPGNTALSPEQISLLEKWIEAGASWPSPPVTADSVAAAAIISDSEFLRRVYLDTVGVPPTEDEARGFLADASAEKRSTLVDRLLADERVADHWISYWQDVLAENPTMLNPSLNTTGPFRWFLYESLRDNKPLDRMVTELILLRGSPHEGGSAGFGIAADNEAPFAAKGQIIANAFLGIELQCARCHDSPFHSTKQKDLYSLAAMLERKPVTVPKTSRVPAAFFEAKARESLIRVTLTHDESISPEWPFSAVTGISDDAALASLLQKSDDARERLAALVTAPQNSRFAQVIVNRIWRRYLGAGIVEPPHDWEGHAASHPELLAWLAQEFVTHDYDVRHLSKLILTSQVYQRHATGKNLQNSAELRFFNAPDRRRLSAEQIVDSLHVSAGISMDIEELTFDPDGRRASSNRLTLEKPRRAWMFASLANERDRPTLSLPRAQQVADILEAFGWTGSRQNPRTDREMSPNVLQPGVLANSTASVLLTRASVTSGLAEIAVTSVSPEELVDRIFLRYLSRYPSDAERAPLADALKIGFDTRMLSAAEVQVAEVLEPLPTVTWSNHLRSEGNIIAMEIERRARTGTPVDPRLREEWREVFEDIVWSVINIREFVWVP